MPGATTTTQPLSLQSLEEAGAGETPPLNMSVTHPVQQTAWPWAPLFYLVVYYLSPQSIFAEDPLCVLCPAAPEQKDESPQSCLLDTAGKDWSYMEKLVMKAVLGISTSKVASRDSLARLTILLVMTV